MPNRLSGKKILDVCTFMHISYLLYHNRKNTINTRYTHFRWLNKFFFYRTSHFSIHEHPEYNPDKTKQTEAVEHKRPV